MTTKRLILCWLFILLAIALPLLGSIYTNWQRNHFTCKSHIIYVDDNGVLDMISKYTFSNGTGNHEFSGHFTKKNQHPLAVSYKNSFDYWNEKDATIMVSDVNNEFPEQSKILRNFIPDFYQLQGRAIRFEIVTANPLSYYFIYEKAPVAYCKKNNDN